MGLKIVQDTIRGWIQKKGFNWSSYAQYCHLVEEVGELGEAIVVRHGEREAGDGSIGLADHTDIEEELGDVLFSVFALANKYDIDMEATLKKTMERYDKKFAGRKN